MGVVDDRLWNVGHRKPKVLPALTELAVFGSRKWKGNETTYFSDTNCGNREVIAGEKRTSTEVPATVIHIEVGNQQLTGSRVGIGRQCTHSVPTQHLLRVI